MACCFLLAQLQSPQDSQMEKTVENLCSNIANPGALSETEGVGECLSSLPSPAPDPMALSHPDLRSRWPFLSLPAQICFSRNLPVFPPPEDRPPSSSPHPPPEGSQGNELSKTAAVPEMNLLLKNLHCTSEGDRCKTVLHK